jgi:hypothetical protein
MPQLFLITIYLPNSEEPLYFKVTNFKRAEGRVQFIDRKTGFSKDFPEQFCAIQGVKE